jgi:hypothetical protein
MIAVTIARTASKTAAIIAPRQFLLHELKELSQFQHRYLLQP